MQAIPAASPRTSRGKRLAMAAVLLLIGIVAVGVAWWLLPRPGTTGTQSMQPDIWEPKPRVTAEELERRSSPFDGLDRDSLSRDALVRLFGKAEKVPPELVALFDGSPTRMPRPGRTGWFAEDREGKWLALPLENEVLLFDPRTMTHRKTLTGAPERIYCVAFSRDGKRLAVGCWPEKDSGVVWEVDTGAQLLRVPLQGVCKSIQFSPDGNYLLTVAEDTTPILWNARTGGEEHRFSPHGQPVWCDAIYTADGKYILTHANGGLVHVWDAKNWGRVTTLEGPDAPAENLAEGRHLALAVSADGKWLAAGSDTSFKVWETGTWKPHPGGTTAAAWIAFAPDGRTLLTAPHQGSERQGHLVTRWDTGTGQRQPARIAPLNSRGAWAVYHLSRDGKTLYGMACDPAEPSIHVFDAATGEERVLPGHAGRVCAVDVRPDGASIASAGVDGTVRLWDVATCRLLHTIARPGKTASQVVFAPDGASVYAGWSEDGVIRAIDSASGRWRQVGVYGPQLQWLAVAPDGALLAAAGKRGVRLWALPDGTPRGELTGVPPSPGPIAFSPDAKILAVAGPESVRLFDTTTGRSARTLEFQGTVRWLAFRPDGQAIAVAGESTGNAVLLFDPAGGAVIQQPAERQDAITGGAWRADGGWLATAAASDGTVRLWDSGDTAPAHRSVPLFEPDTHSIEAIAFAPEGRHLVAATSDGSIAVLRLAKKSRP
jgi:WD40 repeat protein